MRVVAAGRWALAILMIVWGADAFAFDPFRPLPPQPPIPPSNPQTDAKTALGRTLFFDPRLSFTGTESCNSCHDLAGGGDDGRRVSVGALGTAGSRNAPTLWNVAYETVYFWDGRAPSLEAAIAEHLLSPSELGMPGQATVVGRLDAIAGYHKAFAQAFGGKQPLSYDNVTKALASYIRTLVTPNSPFDRYLKGDAGAISEEARRGHRQFIEVGCAACHFWVNFAGPVPGLNFKMGEGFYELFPTFRGSRYDALYDLTSAMGRYDVTHQEEHRHLWRVPTLRNVTLTAPYFHNGSVAALDEAVRVMAKTQLNKDVTDQEVRDIMSFLQTLTAELPPPPAPELP